MSGLDDNVATLKGVGPKKIEALDDLGIRTVYDLLTYFPFRYEDFRTKNLDEISDQQVVTLKGRVAVTPTVNFFGRRRSRLTIKLLVGHDVIPVTFFNQPWLKKQVETGDDILIYGKFDANKKSMAGIKILKPGDGEKFGSIYPANHKITQNTIRQLVTEAYDQYQDQIEDFIPDWILQKYKLENLKSVITNMHFPKNHRAAALARRTAKFDEFFLFQMRMQTLKQQKEADASSVIIPKRSALQKFIAALPYRLTGAQDKVVTEILADLGRPYQMNRLLQGDVGSGKTVVAAIAIYAAVLAGKQAVIMAPTEILAEQHANSLANLFENTKVNIGLLTGDTSRSARNELLPRIKNGEINLVVGTHALFQKEVKYQDLGLAVIDEQHRFGVNQRKAMREKGQATNVLSMTATPIPRTLSITAYGEMDVSVIDELPGGRKPIKTAWIKNQQIETMLKFVRKRLNDGEQVYVVVPLIGESDAVDMRNVTDTYQSFKAEFGDQHAVGLLHGQMNDEDKNEVMDAFKDNKIQVLVSTTVIEVGVDVSNASTIVIYDADHFGLAQLHQLRGRVGRGDQQSYCILIANPKNETGRKRMNVMCSSTDGFFISQKDLELRGPGDILGKNQSGVPTFKVGDPVVDINILSTAQTVAKEIVDDKNWEQEPQNRMLVKRLKSLNQDVKFD
ncbi:ATP-dependent DNA helicase RecG [Fructilactobacillus fructivorans]|uniref:ATP-dependent DNA helicase RecG n=1 Tax=Fructilactobacillus fructivorans TaxID=1614 RepID=A0A0C1Q2X3_9LACO|nr:ATP-dependent DNA helicase RecG [Fructilactobacillus fructivorans]KID42163.1 ATP-dependent DNA helicase RecG [Fructilactobacillus fructivorans]MCT0152056.1 ATP-dependent DNA helicase RecG [Fructilactobacillus fructivorans]MCT2867948.1 ATP-dependent DNA helicase RecG [Fructilactobacillus fructivorans]MCT2868470.1 ATP-dependent DNA helicase RecG [Fructilactobacillus fructivorans]MCT2873470.1 ATP-dependent DNA helicase RecG [Fructilactobacillus fructivorans]